MKTVVPKLPEKLKDIKTNKALIHEVVQTILSNKRAANACTKGRGDVSGGGKKPWRQKGTGRARVGSNRSPIWKGGGITFGPSVEQSFKKRIPVKKKRIAINQMIVQRIKEKNLIVVDSIELTEKKTKFAVKFLEDVFGEIESKTLVILKDHSIEDIYAFRNIRNITVTDWKEINTYKLVKNEKILFSKPAWDEFITSRGLK